MFMVVVASWWWGWSGRGDGRDKMVEVAKVAMLICSEDTVVRRKVVDRILIRGKKVYQNLKAEARFVMF